jgi:flavin-binding protein dodecin
MSDYVYKIINVVGTSKTSIEDAINQAVAGVSESLSTPEWVTVEEIRGNLIDGKLDHYQVVLKLGTRLK